MDGHHRRRLSLKTFCQLQAFVSFGVLVADPALAQKAEALPEISVTSSRTGDGIVGASTSIITADQIARSPGESLQDVLAREPGIQTWSTFGGVNGVGTTIDMRGFGTTAASNTLVLINGRRLTDIDIAGVDFSAIPRSSIERIEITRGNSGAVLYGDGAVGGVINIITKTGVGLPPSARIQGGFGSFNQIEGNASASVSNGPWSATAFSNAINSDGYRVNNALRQRDAVGDFRYTGDQGSAYFNISVDDQHLGLPGARRVTLTSSELVTDRTGATTPTAFAEKQGINLTGGITRNVADGFEVIIDGGMRQKKQQVFSSLFGFNTSDDRILTTASITPRVIIRRDLVGLPSEVTAGIDFYDSALRANRSTLLSDPPIHRYDLTQQTVSAYWQQTVGVMPSTDVAYGARLQNTKVSARDSFDPTAPGAFFFDAQGAPLNFQETQHALHLGIEHRVINNLAVFGRLARSFRTPNVDERVGVSAFPVDFNLRTQTSEDVEAGFRLRWSEFEWQSSAYDMHLRNEILFIPFPPIGANINLDPTRRYGVENSATYRLSDTMRLKGGFAYTRAVFREGPFIGNDVPLVSRWTGSAALSWDIWPKSLVLDVVARYVGERRMDNDQANFQPLIPAHTLVDLRVGGAIEKFFWSIAIQNIFNADYFDYAVASASTFGTYNAYPQPGRTVMVRGGVTF